MATLHKISLSDLIANESLHEVENKLKKFGVAVLPNFVSNEELNAIQIEYDSIRNAGKSQERPDIIRGIGGDKKDYYAYDRHLDNQDTFPQINSFFSHTMLDQLVSRMIGQPCLQNAEIYATFDEGEGKEVLPSHFDKTWNLKFMLYLDDIKKKGQGAFGVHPSTTHLARTQFRHWFNANKRFGAIEVGSELYYSMTNQELPADLTEFIEIYGDAGTLIVFNTDCFHSASKLDIGQSRRVIRAHTYPQRKMLGLGDRLSIWSRHYSRGERWENNSRLYDKFSAIFWLEFIEHLYSIVAKPVKNWRYKQFNVKALIYSLLNKVLLFTGTKSLVKKMLGFQ